LCPPIRRRCPTMQQSYSTRRWPNKRGCNSTCHIKKPVSRFESPLTLILNKVMTICNVPLAQIYDLALSRFSYYLSKERCLSYTHILRVAVRFSKGGDGRDFPESGIIRVHSSFCFKFH
jgi:hypothetical protein